MSDILKDKVVIVTGGSMGIGYACAKECMEEGATVIICARNKDDLNVAYDKLAEIDSKRIVSIPADVSIDREVGYVLWTASTKFGKIDGVIHSAGIYGPIGPIMEISPDEWLNTIKVNLFGSFLVARAAAYYMKNKGGSIVLMSGGGAATPFPNYTAYASSKVGVVRLAETIAQELAPYNIRVNAVAPGFVATRLHQQTIEAGEKLAGTFVEITKQKLEKGAVPPEIPARACAFLLSDAAQGITGKFIAAPYDGWENWPKHLDEIENSDLFTLRRIVPKDRGMNWQ